MCGIIGCAGVTPCAGKLLTGLQKLEYRGYDSAGIAVIQANKLEVHKENGRLQNLIDELDGGKHLNGRVGIGHTRWATHGKPSEENAHPHISGDGHFAVVHNGIIENYASLKTDLTAKGYFFTSGTDTEVIAHLLQECRKKSVLETIKTVTDMLEGSYALGILCDSEPDALYCARKSSPLIIGVGEEENFIASDAAPLLAHTRNVIPLSDGEIAELKYNEIKVYNTRLEKIDKKINKIHRSVETAEKGGFEHFMQKEIFEQPQALRSTIEPRIRNGKIVIDELEALNLNIGKIKKIFIVACGSAYHAGVAGKYVIEQMTGIDTEVEVASEFRGRNPIIDEHTLCIVISQSGETADTVAALRQAKSIGAKTVAVVNVEGSTIANESDCVLYTSAGPEISVATTKAYSCQLAMLYIIAMYFAQRLGTVDDEYYRNAVEALLSLPRQVEKTLEWDEPISRLAQRYAYLEHAYFIGRNLDYATALEASLKLKEISYIHSEAYPAGELKHGTISLIEEGTFVVGLMCCDNVIGKTLSNIKEVRARGAEVLSITSQSNMARVSRESDRVITVPDFFQPFMPSIQVVPMQLLGYHIAKARNCDIDKPRNLAKSVTVE